MDGIRFDELTRRLAAGASRRTVLKGIAGGFVAALAGRDATDARRAARQANGLACTRATDCASFQCVDGVCCDDACLGQCEACNLPGSEGTCLPVSGAPVGSRPACPGSGPCAATCDGQTTSHCAAFPGNEVACGTSTCVDGVQTGFTCSGNGSCAQTTTTCGLFVCDPTETICLTSCQTIDDCVGQAHCANGVCQGDAGLGTPCASADACQSGFCAGNVCCAEPCDQPCHTCTTGFCEPVTNDTTCAGGICCDGACIDPTSDPEHCGGCDAACGGGHICVNTDCVCPDGATECNGTCLPADCPGNQVLDVGTCQCVCPGEDVPCGTSCVPPCSDGKEFDAACQCVCPAGTTLCNAACVDDCPSGQVLNTTTCSCDDLSNPCPDDQILCGDACVDTDTDRENCGDCGNLCGQGENCCDGSCRPPGSATDPTDCGPCGVQCPAGQVCRGTCCNLLGDACEAGGECCGEFPICCDGTCRDPRNDPLACGECGNVCPVGGGCEDGVCCRAEGQACVDGSVQGRCCAGLDCCGGICRNTLDDDDHCGVCDNACTGDAHCSLGNCCVFQGGSCTTDDECRCNPDILSFQCCDNICRLLTTDEEHCGACGNACAFGETCIDSACEAPPCTPFGQFCTPAGSCCTANAECRRPVPEVPVELCLCPEAQPDLCDDRCVDLQTSFNDCGTCGHRCSSDVIVGCILGQCF